MQLWHLHRGISTCSAFILAAPYYFSLPPFQNPGYPTGGYNNIHGIDVHVLYLVHGTIIMPIVYGYLLRRVGDSRAEKRPITVRLWRDSVVLYKSNDIC